MSLGASRGQVRQREEVRLLRDRVLLYPTHHILKVSRGPEELDEP